MSNYIDNIVKNAVTYDLVSKPLANDMANEFSIQSTYAVGDYVMHDYKLYKCISAVTTAGNWNSAKWQECKIGDEINGGVKYTAQTLTSEQKAQARNNIGAVSQEEATPDAVRYSAQSLTDAQKNQARVNVGTVASTSIAEEFSTSKAYAVGDMVMYDSKLYKFKTAHSAGAWNNAQVDAVSVKEEISSLSSDLNVKPIPNNSDLNSYTEPGLYSVETNGMSITNFPEASVVYSVLEVFEFSTGYIVQRLMNTRDARLYSRRKYAGGGTWSNWFLMNDDFDYQFTPKAKNSLMFCLWNLAWSIDDGINMYNSLYAELFGTQIIKNITEFTSGAGSYYDGSIHITADDKFLTVDITSISFQAGDIISIDGNEDRTYRFAVGTNSLVSSQSNRYYVRDFDAIPYSVLQADISELKLINISKAGRVITSEDIDRLKAIVKIKRPITS